MTASILHATTRPFGIEWSHRIVRPRIDAIIKAYCRMTGVRIEDLAGQSKAQEITAYRHELMFLVRRLDPAASLSLIARYFGGRDMATVHEAIVKVDGLVLRDRTYRARLTQIAMEIVGAATSAPAEADPVKAVPQKPWQLLAATQVLRDDEMTDAEARKAALSFLQQLEAGHG